MTFRYAAQCGTLTVFEDRSARSGRQIDLRIAVLPATGNTVAPDPLFLLAGGPGQAATEALLSVLSAFDRINRKRDVVLVDQRGTGKSYPLRCPQEHKDLAALPDVQLAVELKTCLSQLDADPRLYTTSIAMDDLDQVRSALGYNKINLYGASYGTRAALTYLRQHPESVRTVILDGVMPQDGLLGSSAARDAPRLDCVVGYNAQSSAPGERALNLIWDRCEAEPACRAAFPNIRTEFETLLATLERQPAQVTVAHPVTGVPTEVTLTRRQVASTVRLLSYSSENAALLPLLVHAAQSTGDYSRLAAQYLILNDDLDQRVSDGTYWSILCAEDAAFLAQEAGSPQVRTYLDDVTAEIRRVCATWPRGPVSADFRQPVTSETPVLLLSGEADPVTPPANGDQAARTLSNSLHLVAPGQGHTVIVWGCIPKIAAAFVESGTVKGLESDCVKHIQPTPFFVSFAGPDS
jgi:pimeloyl-ACP methyl ester carboxylesterase